MRDMLIFFVTLTAHCGYMMADTLEPSGTPHPPSELSSQPRFDTWHAHSHHRRVARRARYRVRVRPDPSRPQPRPAQSAWSMPPTGNARSSPRPIPVVGGVAVLVAAVLSLIVTALVIPEVSRRSSGPPAPDNRSPGWRPCSSRRSGARRPLQPARSVQAPRSVRRDPRATLRRRIRDRASRPVRHGARTRPAGRSLLRPCGSWRASTRST